MSRRAGIALALVLTAASLSGFEGRLLLAPERPAAGFQVAILGSALTARTGVDGRFVIDASPPFTIVAIGPRGEIYHPVEITAATAGAIVLRAGFGESVTVTPAVAPNIAASPAASKLTIGQEDLEERRPQRLTDALAGVAGVSRLEEGASGVPVVRGLARGRTLILLDDARVTTERRAGPSATFLDPFTIGSIELARGPGSVAYGSDAFGGVIHVRPRDPERGGPRLRFDLSFSAGGLSDRAAGVSLSHDLGRGSILYLLHARDAGDATDGGGAAIADSSARDSGGAVRWALDTGAVRVRAGLAIDEGRDIGKPATDSNVVRSYYPRETSRRLTFGLDTASRAGWSSIELRGGLSDYRLVLDRDRRATGTRPRHIDRSDVDANDATLRLIATRPFHGGSLTAGGDVHARFDLRARTTAVDFPPEGGAVTATGVAIDDAGRTGGGAFAIYERPLPLGVSISAGLRGDRIESRNRGGHFGDRAVRHGAVSGQLAATRARGPWSATLQITRGFREPTLSDRFFRGASGRGFVTGNPDLGPETSLQYDATVRWSPGALVLVASAYRYDIRDLIERYGSGDDFFFRNRGEARIEGAEVEAFVSLPQRITLQVAAAVARGRAYPENDPLGDIAAPSLQTTLRRSGARSTIFGRAIVAARKRDAGPAEVGRPGHVAVDLGATWKLPAPLELRVVVRNAGDRRYAESYDEKAAPAPGRSITFGVIGSFPAR